ncbi:MAG: cytochrome b/b6 domain-containing protein [Bryobacterales bacterium]
MPGAHATPMPRHSAWVRSTHWIGALCFLALAWSGAEIVLSHPRFYWGEDGNVLTEPLFQLPVPSSRPYVPTGYDYVLPDQNGWSRSLHFQSAWFLVFAGAAYWVWGLLSGHFARNVLPGSRDLSGAGLSKAIASHLRFEKPADTGEYNVLQRAAYSVVVFVLLPVMLWTGLAMSPAVVSVFPSMVDALGGHQSARTLHFVVFVALMAFLAVHVWMVYLAGFRSRVGAMIRGKEQA